MSLHLKLSDVEAWSVILTTLGLFTLWVGKKVLGGLKLINNMNDIVAKELTTNGGTSIKDVANQLSKTNTGLEDLRVELTEHLAWSKETFPVFTARLEALEGKAK